MIDQITHYFRIVYISRAIKGTHVLAKIKGTEIRGKDQTWKTDKHTKEHKVTKIIYAK